MDVLNLGFSRQCNWPFGVQYLALSASHPMVVKLAESDPELQAFLDTLTGLPLDSKVGYMLTQFRAINPLAYHDETPDATKASLPVYVAPYVLGDYGEGAVMGVPGHDVRDFSFWKEHQKESPVRFVVTGSESVERSDRLWACVSYLCEERDAPLPRLSLVRTRDQSTAL